MPTGDSAEFVLVGHVRKPHGVRGELLIEVLSDVDGRFRPGAELIVEGPGFARATLVIRSVRSHRGGLLLLFEEIDQRDRADDLRGANLMIRSQEVGRAPEGSYFFFDLIGRVCTDRRAGQLGEVVAVREDGGGLLLEIRDEARTVLVPFVREYLVSIDESDRPIEFDLPEGLLEVCASR